jgi:DNA-binding MarR family transcriptional regulator
MTLNENQNLFESIFKLTRALKTRDPHGIKNSDLTILQIHTLIFVSKNQPIPMHEIADSFQITKPTATSLIDVLMKLGFVSRVEDKEDRRITRIKLSKTGEDFLQKNMSKTSLKINKILDYLTPKDKKDLKRIIDTINKRIEEEHEKNIK